MFEQLNATKNQYVQLATNLDEKNRRFYFFYLPMVVEAWSYEPIIFLVSSTDTDLENFNEINTISIKKLNYLKKLDVKLIQVISDPNFGVMTSMISRLFVGAIDFLEDVLTSDSDLIPISKAYFQVQDYDAIGA